MKSVLLSIQPQWCARILNCKKTVEVRKTKPKLETPFKVYIYCTKGNFVFYYDDSDTEKYKYDVWDYAEFHQKCNKKILSCKVIGEFLCDNISTADYGNYVETFSENALMTAFDLLRYARGKTLFGWHISNLVIYDKPRELSEFRKAGFMTEENWLAALYLNTHCHYEAWAKKFIIERPPQSWCFVESEVVS